MSMIAIRWRAHLTALICVCGIAGTYASASSDANSNLNGKRTLTIEDVIGMTKLAGDEIGRSAPFSPDHKQFVVLVKRGNIERNTSDYTLMLFRTADVLRHRTAPNVLARFSSSTNRAGIDHVSWVDNRTIAFLGESTSQNHQLFLLDTVNKSLTQLTHHETSLVDYSLSANSDQFFFLAEMPEESLMTEAARRYGIVVSSQPMVDLIALRNIFQTTFYQQLFGARKGEDKEISINTLGILDYSPLSLSPDGRYLIVMTALKEDPPAEWLGYMNSRLQQKLRAQHAPGSILTVRQFELIDTSSYRSRLLIDAPLSTSLENTAAMWSADSHSAMVVGTYLPLSNIKPSEVSMRQKGVFVAEINIENSEEVPIIQGEFIVQAWDAAEKLLILDAIDTRSTGGVAGERIAYQKSATGWRKLEPGVESTAKNTGSLSVSVEEDMNTRPKIWAHDPKKRENILLLDLNPQFDNIALGRVESITFQATDGRQVKAGLYTPPNYMPNRRYPLVIQTHAWNPARFWIDGPYTTAYAAQPLAARGIVVAQLDEDQSQEGTPAEVRQEMTAYEGVIDYLDKRGVIDRQLVGLLGFSRTGLGAKYALTHSTYHFAAATIPEGSDEGYVAYITTLNSHSWLAADYESVNGGLPFGSGLSVWLQNSPGFNLDKVSCPVRLEANYAQALPLGWEWFAGLRRLHKAVELIYIPDGEHVLEKPWNRLTSQGGTVDWFDFWLNGHEDPDPAKASQYKRWEMMKSQVGVPAMVPQ